MSKSTKTWLNADLSWTQLRNQTWHAELISSRAKFSPWSVLYRAQKKSSKDYEPESLAVMQASPDSHLKENGYTTSIVRNPQVCSSNKILKGKATKLREEGKGSRPNASKVLTWSEEIELWQAGKLGVEGPETLIHTLWFTWMQQMGLRGSQEDALTTLCLVKTRTVSIIFNSTI